MNTAVRITIYLNESQGSLCNQILHFLSEHKIAAACAFHAVAGFMGRSAVHTAGLVEGGGNVPVTLTFVDLEEHVERVLPRVREMAHQRLIVRENVSIVQPALD